MPSVIAPGNGGDSGGVASLSKRPGRGRTAQRNPPGCRGTARVRTVWSTRQKPEHTASEVKPTRAGWST